MIDNLYKKKNIDFKMEEFEHPEFQTAKTITEYHRTQLNIHTLDNLSQNHSTIHDRSEIDHLLETSFIELDQLPPLQEK